MTIFFAAISTIFGKALQVKDGIGYLHSKKLRYHILTPLSRLLPFRLPESWSTAMRLFGNVHRNFTSDKETVAAQLYTILLK